jgi:ABC-type nitrate/sulfonate/bicarbonate transport system substrate-binding protein
MDWSRLNQVSWACAVVTLLEIVGFSNLTEAASFTAKGPVFKLRVAYAAPIGVMAPLWMAAASGAFRAQGLEVEMVFVEPSATIAALIAKEVDAVEQSAPAMIPAVLAGGDVTMIAGLLNRMIFSFHAQKDIQSAAQLRGKIIGTDRLGTAQDYGTRVALSLMGFKSESGFQLLRIGNTAVLWVALQSGQIQGAALTPPPSFKADAAGYTRLVNTYDLPYQNIGVVVRKSDVEPRAEMWARFLRSLKEGIQRWYDDPKLAKEVLTKYTKEKDPEMLQKTHDFFTKQAGFTRDLALTDQGLQQILTFLGSTVLPGAKDATPAQFYDTRILQRLGK